MTCFLMSGVWKPCIFRQALICIFREKVAKLTMLLDMQEIHEAHDL
ncbi:hypothetical protein LINPERHAP1_LOCUS32392 [Linum perenne]